MRRRRYQRGGLSQRKRNGRLYWYLQWREDGRPKSKELGLCSEMNRAEAETQRAKIMAGVNEGLTKPERRAYSLVEFLELVYLPVKRRMWKISTTMTTEALINAHLADLKPRPLDQLTRHDLQDLLDRVAASGRSRSVVKHLLWQFHAIFEMAMGEGAVSVNPARGLSVASSAAPPKEKLVMSPEDVQKAQQALPTRERLLFRLATIEGMRPGEILGLQLQDVGEQSVKVSRRVYRGDVDTPKTGRSREVALSAVTRALISEVTALLVDQRPAAWLFQSENVSNPLMRDNVQRRLIRPKLEKVGLGWVTFQVMRRTNASLAHKLGIDPKVAADQRGHGLGVSMAVYTQSDLAQKLKAVSALETEAVQ